MTIGLFGRKFTGIDLNGTWESYNYYLPDMNYGGFLIYQDRLPKYYINFIDEKFIDMRDYIHTHNIDAETLLKKICKISPENNLALRPKSKWFAYKVGKEESFDYEIEEFPISIWNEVKGKL
jgi:hypothetical protein